MFREAGDASFAFSDVTLVNNAGSIGPIAPISSDTVSLDLISRMATLNYVVPAFLASEFVRRFSSVASVLRLTVAHVSSLWALQAQSRFATYCSSKAGIEMFMRVLAEEQAAAQRGGGSEGGGGERPGPSVKVLNYAPGPLDTDMQLALRTAPELDEASRKVFSHMKEESKLVDPVVSATKLARLVIEDLFESGSHVDFYDEVAGIDKALLKQTTCCACTYCECGPACQCKSLSQPQCDSCSVFVAAAREQSNKTR
jgi:sepiapterin reductase